MKSFSEKAIINMVENLFSVDGNSIKHAKHLSYFNSSNNCYFIVFGEKIINIFLNGDLKKQYSVNQSENIKDAERYAKEIFLEIKNKYCVWVKSPANCAGFLI